MTTDIHVHLPGPLRGAASAEELVPAAQDMLEAGRSVGIDKQVILGLASAPENHLALRDLVAEFPGELYPFMSGSGLDPGCPAMLEKCVKEYGFKGVKIHQSLPEFPLTALGTCHGIYTKAAELGVPVLAHSWHQEEGLETVLPAMHTGYFPMAILQELGRRHPKTVFIFAHAGGMWVKAFQAARPYPNICFDVSGFDPERGIVEKAVEVLGPERVLFGSDAPGRSYAAQLAKVQHARISDSDKRLILGENAARLLHLRRVP